jgi:hypothetical protein
MMSEKKPTLQITIDGKLFDYFGADPKTLPRGQSFNKAYHHTDGHVYDFDKLEPAPQHPEQIDE